MPFWHRAASLPLAILPSHPYLAPFWIVRTFSNTLRPPKRLALNVLVYLFPNRSSFPLAPSNYPATFWPSSALLTSQRSAAQSAPFWTQSALSTFDLTVTALAGCQQRPERWRTEVLDFCTGSHKSWSFTRRKSRTSNNPVPVLRIPSKYGWMSCSLNERNLARLRHKLQPWSHPVHSLKRRKDNV